MLRTALIIFLSQLATALGSDDNKINVFVPSFGGDSFGQNVGTIFNLQVLRTLRIPQNAHGGSAPGGKVFFLPNPFSEFTHSEVERVSKDLSVQLTLWGNALPFGKSTAVQSYLTIPYYKDLRPQRLEEWSEEVPNDSGATKITVDLPRRRYEFSPILLDQAFVEKYRTPSALKLYEGKGRGEFVGIVGPNFTALRYEGRFAYVSRDEDHRKGWLELPDVENDKEIVNFVGGLVRLMRGDYPGAIDLFKTISASEAPHAVKIDALLLGATAKAKLGQDPRDDIDQALALNPYQQSTIKFKVLAVIREYRNAETALQKSKIAQKLTQILDEKSYLFSSNDPWLAQAKSIETAIKNPQQH